MGECVRFLSRARPPPGRTGGPGRPVIQPLVYGGYTAAVKRLRMAPGIKGIAGVSSFVVGTIPLRGLLTTR
ncbi:hypothetical protein SSCG_05734 [Streptomyces clavuligerus]|nr:hypothetical protein SSCG_05734 [Streptomyces clavuligerus]